jgi:membrane protease YdiL (CAAX protease family)
MSPEELEAWLMDHPWVIAYVSILLLGSLASLIVLIVQITKAKRIGTIPVSPWKIANLDFTIFAIVILFWFSTSGLVVLSIFQHVAGENSKIGTGAIVTGGLVLHGGMLYIFLMFRHMSRNPNEGPLSPKILSLGRSMALGLFYFLASLPIVYGVGLVWGGFLEMLRRLGFEVDLPLQDAVILIQETDSAFGFFGLLVLAVVVAPIVEESVFRGGVYRFCKGKTSIFVSLLISGLAFGLIHFNIQSLPGLVAVGVCLGLAYELSGSLRVSIFFHAFFNLNSILWIFMIPEAAIG